MSQLTIVAANSSLTRRPATEGIVRINPQAFIGRFPELADSVPMMLAHEGVQPYNDGLPRVFKAGAPTLECYPRPTRLSIVPAESTE